MKKWGTRILFLAIGLVLGMVAMKSYYDKVYQDPAPVEMSREDYDALSKGFHKIGIRDLKNEDHSLKGIVFVGRPSCESCKLMVRVMNALADKYKIVIHYFDSDAYRDEKGFEEVMNQYDVRQVPDVFYIAEDGTYERQSLEALQGGERFDDWIEAHGVRKFQ